MTEPMIEVDGLVKAFGAHRALDGVDLTVPAGSVLGLLGPNGAGKTTTVRILTTLLRPDAGRARVAGHDVQRDPHRVRTMIGTSGQYAAVDPRLTGAENLYLVGRLYGMRRRVAAARSAELLDRFRLGDAARRLAGDYSGGMRRRLDLAGALVAAPPVVILDEPTTGLDPRARQDVWDVLGDLVRGGTTVLLTTQYLEEADQLADTIAVVDRGRVIARGTADELKAEVGGVRVEVTVAREARAGAMDVVARVLADVGAGPPSVDARLGRAGVRVDVGPKALIEVVRALEAENVELADAGLRRATLDEAFLSLTGTTDAAAAEPVAATR